MTTTTDLLNEPPDDLEERWSRLWSTLRDQLEAANRWSPLTSSTLTRYVRALRSAELHQAVADQTPTVEGSMGQPREHPSLKAARSLAADADELAKELRLRDLRFEARD